VLKSFKHFVSGDEPAFILFILKRCYCWSN